MKVKIIGVPMDLGADRRGVDMGPSAIRYAKLQRRLEENDIQVCDWGDIEVPNPETKTIKNPKLKYFKEIIKASEELADIVYNSIYERFVPLILGGDHSISLGSIAGASKAIEKIGVIWIDAHGDFNTDTTTPTGNIHGMSLAASLGIGNEYITNICGFCPKVLPQKTVLIGARCIDKDEAELIKSSGIHVFTMEHIDFYGIKDIVKKAIELVKDNTAGVHLSFDVDVIEPTVAPGVGTPVRGGINYREASLIMEMLAKSKVLSSLEFVEVNPILDKRNETAQIAVDLIASALGERIL